MAENKDIDLHFEIFPCRLSYTGNLEFERRAMHEEIEIKCFYEGSSVLIVGENKIEVKAGDIVVINPYEFHATIDKGVEGNIGKYHLFMIPLDIFSNNGIAVFNFRNLLLGSNAAFQTVFRDDKRMFKILMRVIKEYQEKKKAYNMAIVGMMMEFFAILMRKGICDNEKSIVKNNNQRLYALLEPAIRHIRDNFKNDITVEQLAGLCHVSKQYFCRAFKNLTGKTVMEYLREYRLKISDTMLSNTDNNIASIAEECGFESMSYFSRSYKNYYGFTPRQRRQG